MGDDRNCRSGLVHACWLGAVALMLAPSQAGPSVDPAGLLAKLRPRAIDQVLESARCDDPYLRANALETAKNLPDRVVPLVHLGLEDEAAVVRFTALATVGKLRLAEVAVSTRGLLADDDFSVRAAAMFAMRQCGLPVDITPMAQMLASNEPNLRSNVAMLLGFMGDASAVPMLKEMANRPLPRATDLRAALVRIQIAEAILKLGDNSSLDAVRAGAYSTYDEVRVLAVSIMGDIGDRRMIEAVRDVLHTPPLQVQVAAAVSLAKIGWPQGLGVLIEAADSIVPMVRSQAAMGLAWYRHEADAVRAMTRLMEDKEEAVRLSAAAAVLAGLSLPKR